MAMSLSELNIFERKQNTIQSITSKIPNSNVVQVVVVVVVVVVVWNQFNLHIIPIFY